jgi:hypothetical protein
MSAAVYLCANSTLSGSLTMSGGSAGPGGAGGISAPSAPLADDDGNDGAGGDDGALLGTHESGACTGSLPDLATAGTTCDAVLCLVGVEPTFPDGRFALSFSGAIPNPIAIACKLNFVLPSESPVRLEIFDLAGRTVRTVANGTFGAGPHAIEWDGRTTAGAPVPSGIYFARLKALNQTLSRRVLVQR